MEIAKVIKMRTALKAGKNLPLTVLIDNCFRVIDESMKGHFTFWDDDNGILYEMAYADIMQDKSPRNEKKVSMFAVEYESIQCMQLSLVKLDDIDALFGSMKAEGKTVAKERIDMIKNFYNTVLSNDIPEISRENINNLIGSNLNTNDDYYAGRMTQNFKESVRYRDRNKAIDEAKNNG